MARKQEYTNESITSLKGADRVRKRPGVIFGSDGVEGCAHAIFEILSNSIDEAREGYGDKHHRHPVTRTTPSRWRTSAGACPVDYNKAEERYNWELLFCEMYAGGKYYRRRRTTMSIRLGLNGLGLCATQYSSE